MVESKRYIIDASVILKWMLDEKESFLQAQKCKEDAVYERCVLYCAEHTYAEVANILGRINFEYIVEDLSHVFDQGLILPLPHSAKMVTQTVEIMKLHSSITYYDASYHALALLHNAIFLTADEKYYRLTKKLGHSMLLKDYPVS